MPPGWNHNCVSGRAKDDCILKSPEIDGFSLEENDHFQGEGARKASTGL